MNFMVLFLVLCLILGLWGRPNAKRGWMVAALAVALVLFFVVAPRHM